VASGEHIGDGDAQSGWTAIDRSRFHELWDDLPSLTVLAALPGWGRSAWMSACRDRIANGDDAVRTITVGSRRAAEDALQARSDDEPAVLFIDDVIVAHDDPLWTVIASTVAGTRTRIVVSSVDLPAKDLLADAHPRILDERDLRFTVDELALLVAANDVVLTTDTRDDLSAGLRGAPLLVRRQLERTRARRADGVWTSVSLTHQQSLVESVLAMTDDPVYADSAFLGLLRSGTGFRRFSTELVSADDETARVAATQFDRLAAIPLGELDDDDETGQRDFIWSTEAWQKLSGQWSVREREQQLLAALRRSRESGRVTIQLFYLLEVGRVDEAEALVFDQFRRFLIFTDAVTQTALLAASSDELDAAPNLLLLASELRQRVRGLNPHSLRDAQRAFTAFRIAGSESAIARFRILCRRAMAASFAGRRADATRCLAQIADTLESAEGSPVRLEAERSADVASRVAGDLFLAFWTAIQTDQHDLALEFTRITQEYGDPADIVTRIDRLTAMTEEDFAGVRSLGAADARPEGLEFSHTASVVLLEEGADREAFERTHPLARKVQPAPTRSAADALLLLSWALIAPDRLSASQISSTLALSRSFWDDGEPSTFIVFGATAAHLALGHGAEARALAAERPDADWFTLAAAALVELAADHPEAAVELLERSAEHTALPRLQVIGGVLMAVAMTRLGLTDAAAAHLEALWQAIPAPRLLRFALRMTTPADYARVVELADAVSPPIADVIRDAADDRRTLGTAAAPRPTAAEREILALLRQGRSNAEIAALRGVTQNTVRTQLRLLYRKLRVEGRVEAVALAERADVLSADA